ncbi:hypothetical protein GQ42DRAFT_24142 [Ramicandelaber brevisporus]|nr:hypothetical protein GQ42DRAFT_24142 [Ramicandelaber brevisporus]
MQAPSQPITTTAATAATAATATAATSVPNRHEPFDIVILGRTGTRISALSNDLGAALSEYTSTRPRIPLTRAYRLEFLLPVLDLDSFIDIWRRRELSLIYYVTSSKLGWNPLMEAMYRAVIQLSSSFDDDTTRINLRQTRDDDKGLMNGVQATQVVASVYMLYMLYQCTPKTMHKVRIPIDLDRAQLHLKLDRYLSAWIKALTAAGPDSSEDVTESPAKWIANDADCRKIAKGMQQALLILRTMETQNMVVVTAWLDSREHLLRVDQGGNIVDVKQSATAISDKAPLKSYTVESKVSKVYNYLAAESHDEVVNSLSSANNVAQRYAQLKDELRGMSGELVSNIGDGTDDSASAERTAVIRDIFDNILGTHNVQFKAMSADEPTSSIASGADENGQLRLVSMKVQGIGGGLVKEETNDDSLADDIQQALGTYRSQRLDTFDSSRDENGNFTLIRKPRKRNEASQRHQQQQ